MPGSSLRAVRRQAGTGPQRQVAACRKPRRVHRRAPASPRSGAALKPSPFPAARRTPGVAMGQADGASVEAVAVPGGAAALHDQDRSALCSRSPTTACTSCDMPPPARCGLLQRAPRAPASRQLRGRNRGHVRGMPRCTTVPLAPDAQQRVGAGASLARAQQPRPAPKSRCGAVQCARCRAGRVFVAAPPSRRRTGPRGCRACKDARQGNGRVRKGREQVWQGQV